MLMISFTSTPALSARAFAPAARLSVGDARQTTMSAETDAAAPVNWGFTQNDTAAHFAAVEIVNPAGATRTKGYVCPTGLTTKRTTRFLHRRRMCRT